MARKGRRKSSRRPKRPVRKVKMKIRKRARAPARKAVKVKRAKAVKRQKLDIEKISKAARSRFRQKGISSAKTIAERAQSELLAKELNPAQQKREGPVFYDPDKPQETSWVREAPAVRPVEKEESPVMKVVRGLIKDKEPKEKGSFDPGSKDLRLRRQGMIEDIEAKREEIRRVPRNGQHKEKLVELSRQLTALKQQLWNIEKELRPKAG